MVAAIARAMSSSRAAVDPPTLPSLADVQRDHIVRVLDACHGIRTLAARVLRIDRKTLYRMLKRYDVRLSVPDRGSPSHP